MRVLDAHETGNTAGAFFLKGLLLQVFEALEWLILRRV